MRRVRIAKHATIDEQKTRRSTNQMGGSMGMTAVRGPCVRACTHRGWVRVVGGASKTNPM